MKRLAMSMFLLVFATAFAHADPQPTAPVAPRAPVAPVAPAPPTPPTPPAPPAPPAPPKNADISVRIHDGKVDVKGLSPALAQGVVEREVQHAIAQMHQTLAANPALPPEVRAKLEARMAKVQAKLQKRWAGKDGKDYERLCDELGEVGEELSELGEEMGQEIAAQYAHGAGAHLNVNRDGDDDADDVFGDGPDGDDDDGLDEAVRALSDIKLAPEQHVKLVKLRQDSERRAAMAKEALHAAAKKLHDQIEHDACDDDISKSIDAVSHQEAELRKARVLAWTGARRLLDDAQRKRVEAMATRRAK